MNPFKMIRSLCMAVAVLAAVFSVQTSKAQLIYSNNFNTDDSANWSVNASYTNTTFNPKTLANFNFDYTTAGIPLAPHSVQFGSAAIHHGLKMSACYTNPATLLGSAVTAGISAAPTNFSISANFVLHADVWLNVNGSAYAALNTNNFNTYTTNNGVITTNKPSFACNNNDGTASTVLYGCGYGTAGTVATTPGVTDAIWVGLMTDNGSSAQYRMYGPSIQASYQDGNYQSTGTSTPGFPGDPLVYDMGNAVNGAGTRNMIGTTGNAPYSTAQLSTNIATGVLWGTIFPPAVVPLAQQIQYPQQTNNCCLPGFLDFAWHDVSVEKVGNVIIYKVDGNIIATGNYSSAGTPPGGFLTFVATRTGASVASTASGSLYTNLNFVVFANITVSNYNNVVNVSAPTPTTSEGTPTSPGIFTISRSSAGVPLTVSYTLTGTATNGVQYTNLPTSVTFSSTATTTNVYVTAIDDGIPNPTTTVVLTLQSGANYAGAGNAVVNILDNDPTTIDISGSSQAYGRYTNTLSQGNNDFISYTLTRRGKLAGDVTVNLSYSGTAVPGADFAPISSITAPDGVSSVSLSVPPLYNASVTTNRSVIVSVASGTGYNIGNGPATGTIVSANYAAPAAVLLTDALTDSTDATNWNITYGCGDPADDATDYEANFGMSLDSAAGGISIPYPPSGNTTALHLTCNKDVTPGSAGGVNAYYTNLVLNGDYAVRFQMNVIEGQQTATSTEGALFGINHSGSLSNWWYGSGPSTSTTYSSDGVWYFMTAQPSGTASGDYQEFTGLGGTNNNTGWTRVATQSASTYSQVYKDNPGPFTTLDGFGNGSVTPGVPANGTPALGYDATTWSDVEIKQQHNVVTMSINHTPIFTYTNTTVWTNGYLMLGYSDPYQGTDLTALGSPEAGVYYANLQVVQLAAPVAPTVVTITGISASGGNVTIKFTTSNAADTTGSFTVFSSASVTGFYTAVGATITSIGANMFQAVIPQSGAQQFYRIQERPAP